MRTSGALLVVERKEERDIIGYCGLVDGGRGSDGEPALAFELLRRVERQGYATEASRAVLDWARSCGHARVGATAREWNTASRRVLAKLGFAEERIDPDPVHGNNVFAMRRLSPPPPPRHSGSGASRRLRAWARRRGGRRREEP